MPAHVHLKTCDNCFSIAFLVDFWAVCFLFGNPRMVNLFRQYMCVFACSKC